MTDPKTPPSEAVCVKCGAELRRSKYPNVGRYWFDQNGIAGCFHGGFHEPEQGRESDGGKSGD